MTLAADVEFDVKNGIIDSDTPPNTDLAAVYKKSFAYHTFRVRLPLTLATIIDGLVKGKDDLISTYGTAAVADIETSVCEVTKLREAILSNGTLETFNGSEPDTKLWNDFIEKLPQDKKSYYKACWLYAECYMYRKISTIFKATSSLTDYDYFSKQKQTAAKVSVEAMEAVAIATRNTERNAETFQQLLKVNLWGNRCDLSITSGKQVKPTSNAFEQIAALNDKLLIDSTANIWQAIVNESENSTTVDIVCDNAGYELYTDLILAEYIIDKGLAQKVRFHVKAIPWFISDVMEHDFHWTLQFLRDNSLTVLAELGKKLTAFIESGKFELMPLEHFWTSPYEFYRMKEVKPDLYAKLAESKLVIFKGDLNYRKLLGDFAWDSTESFTSCLRGFQPTNLCTLRTVKAALICGLDAGVADDLLKENPEWMLTGEYGIIQYAQK